MGGSGKGGRDKDEKWSIIGWNARERFLERRSGVIVQPLMAPLQETSIRARSRLCLPLFARNTAVRKVRYARTRPTVKILSCPCQLKMRLRTKTKLLRSKTFKYKTRGKMFRFRCVLVTWKIIETGSISMVKWNTNGETYRHLYAKRTERCVHTPVPVSFLILIRKQYFLKYLKNILLYVGAFDINVTRYVYFLLFLDFV